MKAPRMATSPMPVEIKMAPSPEAPPTCHTYTSSELTSMLCEDVLNL